MHEFAKLSGGFIGASASLLERNELVAVMDYAIEKLANDTK